MNYINLPNDFLYNIASSSSATVAGVAPIVAVILGVLLALVILQAVVGIMKQQPK